MRDPFIGREFQPLGIDHEELDILGRGFEQDAADHGIEGNALPRSGGPGDEEMGHAGQVRDHGVADDILAQGDGKDEAGFAERLAVQDLPEIDGFPVAVGDFNADGGLAGDRGHDPDAGRFQGQGEVIGKGGDPVDLDSRRRLQLVEGDDGSGLNLHDLPHHAEIGQGLFNGAGVGQQGVLPDLRVPALLVVQQGKGRQRIPSSTPHNGDEGGRFRRVGLFPGRRGRRLPGMNAGDLFLPFREDGSSPAEQGHQGRPARRQIRLQEASQGQQGEPEQDHQGDSQDKQEQERCAGGAKGGRKQSCQRLSQQTAGLILHVVEAQRRSQKRKEPGGRKHQSGKSNEDFFACPEIRPDKIQNGEGQQSGGQEENAHPEEPQKGIGKVSAEPADEVMDRSPRRDVMADGWVLRGIGKKAQQQEQGRRQADDAGNLVPP